MLMADMETRKPWLKKRVTKMYDLLGGIDVSIKDAQGRWQFVGSVREAGPIVSDEQLITLPNVTSKKVEVRLRMTKGLWRINTVNLGVIDQKSNPRTLLPASVLFRKSENSAALEKLLDPTDYLVTYPGDEYQILFPEECAENTEYFIESRGYYIEWMREEWLTQEDMKLARQMLAYPGVYLKKMAPHYKKVESEMEHVFWNSKYAKIEK
jgi:hypothetical protein